jgi:hypothetical protein
MANKRPEHRKSTTGHAYRKLQASIFRGTVCARCGNAKGPIVRLKGCSHPTHQALRYCPTHPLAPSLGHKQDLQHGGRPLDPRNAQLEHFGCNASAGVRARFGKRPRDPGTSWDW